MVMVVEVAHVAAMEIVHEVHTVVEVEAHMYLEVVVHMVAQIVAEAIMKVHRMIDQVLAAIDAIKVVTLLATVHQTVHKMYAIIATNQDI